MNVIITISINFPTSVLQNCPYYSSNDIKACKAPNATVLKAQHLFWLAICTPSPSLSSAFSLFSHYKQMEEEEKKIQIQISRGTKARNESEGRRYNAIGIRKYCFQQ